VQGILATSRAFGDTYLKRLDVITAHPDVQHVDIDHDRIAFIILASDGLWDVVSNQNAVNIVREHINTVGNGCREAARHLVRTAIELGSLDNVSVFVIRFDNAPSSS
jgi:protein phosphatase 1L